MSYYKILNVKFFLTWFCAFCSAIAFSLAWRLHLYRWFWNQILTYKHKVKKYFLILFYTKKYDYFIKIYICSSSKHLSTLQHIIFNEYSRQVKIYIYEYRDQVVFVGLTLTSTFCGWSIRPLCTINALPHVKPIIQHLKPFPFSEKKIYIRPMLFFIFQTNYTWENLFLYHKKILRVNLKLKKIYKYFFFLVFLVTQWIFSFFFNIELWFLHSQYFGESINNYRLF